MITVKNKTKHRKYSIVCTSFFIAEGLYNYSCYLSPFPRPAASISLNHVKGILVFLEEGDLLNQISLQNSSKII